MLAWLAGALYILPRYIKGPLAERLGRQLGRPVTVGQASMSPFSFDLRLNEITIGPAADHPEEAELARIESAAARLRPLALLQGQAVLDDLQVDRLRANLLRRTDGSLNLLPPGAKLSGGLSYFPDWLKVAGFQLHRSTAHFFDQPSGKKHLLEHIELVLPPAGQGLEPSLSAVVNSSPLQLTGGKQASGQDTRLTLKLDELDPQQYLGLVPGLAETVALSAERTDAVLEIILQDAGKGLAVTGSVTFSGLVAQSADHEERPEQAFKLAAPTAHVIVRFNPAQKLWTVEELLLDQSQLDLPPSQEALLDGTELAVKAAALLNPEQIGLAVRKLSLNNGRAKSGKKEWTAVQVELTGFQNSKAAELSKETAASVLSLSALNGSSSIAFNGALAPAGNLSGSLKLQNMRADMLRSYLSAEDSLSFSKGSADISGELRLEQQAEGGPLVTVNSGTVVVQDFAVQQKKNVLLVAKSLHGADCLLDGAAKSISCGTAVLDGADFADSSLLLPSGKKSKLRFACGSLELKNSAAKLPFGPAMLPLSGLNLSLTAAKEQQPGQISLEGTVGKKGKVSLSGTAAPGKDGSPLLSGKLNLRSSGAEFLQPCLGEGLSITQGSADLSGNFTLNGQNLSLSGGAIALRDFILQREGRPLLAGKIATGADCALDSGSRRMSCGSITLDGADFADSGFFLAPAGTLRIAAKAVELKNSAAKLPLGGAALPLANLNMSLSGLPGEISLKAAAGAGTVELSGTAAREEAGLALAGTLHLSNVDADLLQAYLGEGLAFSKGNADLSGTCKLSGPTLNLSGGTVAVRDFNLQRGGMALLSGKTASGADCALDDSSQRMNCAKVTLDGTDFADTGFFLAPAGKLRVAANAVELKNASARLLLGGTILPLSSLNMSLSGLPGQVSLTAAAGAFGKLELNGTAAKEEPGLSLAGSLTLRNAEAALLNPYLGDELHFSKGSAEISGAGRLSADASGAKLHLSGGTVAVRDFSLQRGDEALLSGKTASGADCFLNGLARNMSCGRLTVEQGDFAADAPGFFFKAAAGSSRLSASSVDISNSSALLPVGSVLLPLSGLQLRVTDLNGPQVPQNNFHFAAAVGQGSLKADGQLRKDGGGTAALTAERLDLRLFGKAAASLFRDELTIKQGSLSGKGEFRLPEGRYSGSLSLDNVAAASSRGDSLSWQQAAADKAAFVFSPFAAAAEQLRMHEPQLRLTGAEGSLPAAMFALLAAPPNIALDQCLISNGSLQRGGSSFSGVQGEIKPVKAGTAATFSFNGTMSGSPFTASGTAEKSGAALDKLTVERLPLDNAAKELAKRLALDSSRGRLSRTVSTKDDRLDFSGFTPQPKSDYALALAVLTDKDGAFSLPLQALPLSAADEAIVAAAAEMLQKLRDTPPWTVLEKLVPNLPKAERIDFLPGEKLPDFMEGMDSFRTLFSSRPHLGWSVTGCYDQETDRKALLAQAKKSGDEKIEAENARRKQELDRLLAQEVLRQMTLNKAGLPIVKDLLPEIKARPDLQPLPQPQDELPDSALTDLARARAEVVRDHVVSKLGIPAERVRLEESASCGARTELKLHPVW